MINKNIKRIIRGALEEDAAGEDITTQLLFPPSAAGEGIIVAEEESILCGIEIAKCTFRQLDKKIFFKSFKNDGAKLKPGESIALVRGKIRTILSGERVALNFLALLSGISTSTNKLVQKTRGAKAKIMDTRKTIPNLRNLEKYAVKIGGGYSHRMSLVKGIIVKDNHLKAAKCIHKTNADENKINQIISRLRRRSSLKVEIEVENLKEFEAVARCRPDIIMLDNFSLTGIKKAVDLRNKYFPRIKLEASGGITLRNVKRIADIGVDFISVGTITHSPRAVDFSLEIK